MRKMREELEEKNRMREVEEEKKQIEKKMQ